MRRKDEIRIPHQPAAERRPGEDLAQCRRDAGEREVRLPGADVVADRRDVVELQEEQRGVAGAHVAEFAVLELRTTAHASKGLDEFNGRVRKVWYRVFERGGLCDRLARQRDDLQRAKSEADEKLRSLETVLQKARQAIEP